MTRTSGRQQRFGAAEAAGKFKEGIVALELPGRKGPVVFDKDEHNRPGHSLRRDGLKKGVVTLCIGGGQGIALAFEAP